MSDLKETEILIRFVDSIKTAEGTARQFAHSRKDMRWIKVAGLLANIQIKCAELARRGIN